MSVNHRTTRSSTKRHKLGYHLSFPRCLEKVLYLAEFVRSGSPTMERTQAGKPQDRTFRSPLPAPRKIVTLLTPKTTSLRQSWLDLMAITARGILLLKYAIDRRDDLLAIVIGGYR
jgi:hypothetical protein